MPHSVLSLFKLEWPFLDEWFLSAWRKSEWNLGEGDDDDDGDFLCHFMMPPNPSNYSSSKSLILISPKRNSLFTFKSNLTLTSHFPIAQFSLAFHLFPPLALALLSHANVFQGIIECGWWGNKMMKRLVSCSPPVLFGWFSLDIKKWMKREHYQTTTTTSLKKWKSWELTLLLFLFIIDSFSPTVFWLKRKRRNSVDHISHPLSLFLHFWLEFSYSSYNLHPKTWGLSLLHAYHLTPSLQVYHTQTYTR